MAQVFRVIINGEGYDLLGAFAGATMTDWRALMASTGRNPFAVGQGIQQLDKLKDDDPFAALSGPVGGQLMDTIGDLVFLARRMAGDKSTKHPDRPIGYEEVQDNLSFFDAMGALSAAAEAAQAPVEDEPDPT